MAVLISTGLPALLSTSQPWQKMRIDSDRDHPSDYNPGILNPMVQRRQNTPLLSQNDAGFAVKQRKTVPYPFVLDALAALMPKARSMFGCFAIYVGKKIVLALREKLDHSADNGVWLATTKEHHESLRRELPSMRSIQVLGKNVTGWQVVPVDAPDFEQAVLRACDLIIARDPRIGKLPGAPRTSGSVANKRVKHRTR